MNIRDDVNHLIDILTYYHGVKRWYVPKVQYGTKNALALDKKVVRADLEDSYGPSCGLGNVRCPH